MLKTKLNRPKSPANFIVRKEVEYLLESSKHRKLSLVSAPAGYGKSTLITTWLEKNKLIHTWYSLDISDNDIINFLEYTIAGIQSVFKNVGIEALNLLKSRSSASSETIAAFIINDLFEIKEHFYIIFDDYHLIENQEVNHFISFLLDNLPENIHLILITRSDPSIPLARFRSQQLVTDIRLSDLSFSANNIYDFFKKCLDINLTQSDSQTLELKTEGWIAGLQLTGISLQGKDDVSQFVKTLEGDNRHIMDYLLEEVLQQLDQKFREFLLCTSILNQFNADLCNHLLEISNGQEIIEHFERNNMFIIPLDNERNWFRYHHLFSSLLQHYLSVQFKDKISELHAIASNWYEDNNQLVYALEHSLASGNKQKALNHFAKVINQLWENSQYQTILRFGRMFDHEDLIKNVNLCLNYFWILFQSGFIEEAGSLIYKLQNQTTNKSELAMVHVCINNLKVFTGDIESAYTLNELALQNIKEDVAYWNILAFMSLGEVHLFKFELSKSYSSFEKAAKIASESHLIYFEIVNLYRFSYVLCTLGEYSEAYKVNKDVLSRINSSVGDNGLGFELISSMLYCRIGNFLININQIEEGLKKCLHGYNLSKKTTNTLFISSCTYHLAETYYLIGENEKALELLNELNSIQDKKAMKSLCILADSLKIKLFLKNNNEDELKHIIDKDIIDESTHSFERIIHAISKSRYQIENGKILESINLLNDISKELLSEKAYGLLNEVELIKARAYLLLNKHEEAIECVISALLRTQDTGLIRIYIKEGNDIETLIKEIKQKASTVLSPPFNKLNIEYLNHLLRVFEKENKRPNLIEDNALSSRELDTLKLIAENLTNQEIADTLYISVTTVKTHVRNILMKLEAKNRNEAVSKAKEKGILY